MNGGEKAFAENSFIVLNSGQNHQHGNGSVNETPERLGYHFLLLAGQLSWLLTLSDVYVCVQTHMWTDALTW